ncbi:MAG: Uma2 family endonuclease [Planctomycetota bacterium]
MSPAIKYAPRYTVDEYQLWKGDWELWDGFAIAMSPSPFGVHQAALVGLASELRNAGRSAKCAVTFVVELDWIVRSDTVVRPDLMILCGDAPAKHLEHTPAVIAEVLSPSTRKNDLTYKRELYEAEGVGTYLIVDPDAKTVEQLTLSEGGAYVSSGAKPSISFSLCDNCSLSIEAAAVFR